MKNKRPLHLFLIFVSVLGTQTIQAQNDTLDTQVKEKSNINYEYSVVFQYGGESKLGLMFPKQQLIRKHLFPHYSWYYGAEIGPHMSLINWYASFSALTGIEKGWFRLEGGVSHFRTGRVKREDEILGPLAENLLNLKVGMRIGNVCLKAGRHFVLNDYISSSGRRPILDFGKLSNGYWGVELQFIWHYTSLKPANKP